MIRFGRVLDLAGIREPGARRDYRAAVRTLLRADPVHCLAVRLLVPAPLQPHLLACYWFARATDAVADSGPAAGRRERFDHWSATVRRALAGETAGAAADETAGETAGEPGGEPTGEPAAGGPQLAAFARTVAERGLPPAWIDRFLSGMRQDAEGAGLASEEEFERYVDRVSLPYLLLLVGVHPGCREPGHARAYWLLAAACQRIDFLADLAEDSRADRARLPGAELAVQIARARAALYAARPVLDLTPLELRPMMNAFLLMHSLHLEAVERAGERVRRRRVRHPLLPTARLLLAGHGQVRHV